MPLNEALGTQMELVNFELKNGYILSFDKWELDIHNDFDLSCIENNTCNNTVIISLKRNNGSWVDSSQPASILIQFKSVSKFLKHQGTPALASDSNTIAFIGFLFPEDEIMNGYLDILTDARQDLIIGLENEGAIKIHAEQVVVLARA